MTINDFTLKSKSLLDKVRSFYMLFVMLVIASIFFALGRLSVLESKHTPIKIEYSNQSTSTPETANVLSAVSLNNTPAGNSGQVIGVKTSKKYYFPWCGTIKRVKLENQVPFANIETAKAAGYVPGGNCKGLK